MEARYWNNREHKVTLSRSLKKKRRRAFNINGDFLHYSTEQKQPKLVKVPALYIYEVMIVLDKSYQSLFSTDPTPYVMELMSAASIFLKTSMLQFVNFFSPKK